MLLFLLLLLLLGVDVQQVLVESAQTLADICDHVLDTFDAAEKRYLQLHAPAAGGKAAKGSAMEE